MALHSRYENKMSTAFDDQKMLNAWRDVEVAVLQAKFEDTKNSDFQDAYNALAKIGDVNVARKEEIEKETKHDLVAAIRAMAEQVDALHPGKNLGRLIHQGITSYDTEDTAMSLMLAKSGEVILDGLKSIANVFAYKAETFKYCPALGYTHHQVAEPITVGKRFHDARIGLYEQIDELERQLKDINLCKVKGAVGVHSGSLSPRFEAKVASKLGQKVAPVATQILPIEDLLKLFMPFLEAACKIENWAQNMRLLSGAEAEIKEGFGKKQTGSSVMTFKQNPINLENITGACRKLKAVFNELMNCTATWRERDISASFQIRHIVPDMFGTMQHIISKTAMVLEGLQIFPIQSFRNMDRYGDMLFSGALKDWLATNLPQGDDADNEKIYKMVQKESIAAKYAVEFRGERKCLAINKDLYQTVKEKIGEEKLPEFREVLSVSYNLRNVRESYQAAFPNVSMSEAQIHENMVDYIINSGQLELFKNDDAHSFIQTYEKIAERNIADSEFERDGLKRAVAKFNKELAR
ncbi:MAG: hypothetical protein LBH81_00030 [Rickettsiales bacterium]|jgi:adenylosuccinate lyase|nr:hypothetical protein [Rickettsiales bacterium]